MLRNLLLTALVVFSLGNWPVSEAETLPKKLEIQPGVEVSLSVPGHKATGFPFNKVFVLQVDLEGAGGWKLEKVDAQMPEHQHGMLLKPVINKVPVSGARWKVKGMKLHMRGNWRLDLEFQSAKGRIKKSIEFKI